MSSSLLSHGPPAGQAPLSTVSQSLLKFMSVELLMLSNHLILCCLLLLLPSISHSNKVFSNESVLCIRSPQYWSFSFRISSSNDLLFVVQSLVVSDSLQLYGLKHRRPPYPSLSPGLCSNSHPLSQWCYLTISSSVAHFSSYLQSFPTLGSFPVSQFFTSDHQGIGVSASASASVLPVNIQDWFPLRLTGLIPLLSKGLSKVFFSTTIQKHQFFSTQSSLWSNSHMGIWLLGKT